jgi:hypothetical protein
MTDSPPPLSITCPRCQLTSYNLIDICEGYCGRCHDWTRNGARVKANVDEQLRGDDELSPFIPAWLRRQDP